MNVIRKNMRREDWRRILEREYVWRSVNLPEMTGEAGLIRIGKVSAPFKRSMFGVEYNLADDGFAWLQLAPRGENWWATVMCALMQLWAWKHAKRRVKRLFRAQLARVQAQRLAK